MRPISDSPVSDDDDDNNNTDNNDDQQQQPHTDRDSNDRPRVCINTLLESTVNGTEMSTITYTGISMKAYESTF